jgi:hypothetical protein
MAAANSFASAKAQRMDGFDWQRRKDWSSSTSAAKA